MLFCCSSMQIALFQQLLAVGRMAHLRFRNLSASISTCMKFHKFIQLHEHSSYMFKNGHWLRALESFHILKITGAGVDVHLHMQIQIHYFLRQHATPRAIPWPHVRLPAAAMPRLPRRSSASW